MKQRCEEEVCVCEERTSTGEVAGQTLVVHEHFSRRARVRNGVLSSHVCAHNPEAAKQWNKPQIYNVQNG